MLALRDLCAMARDALVLLVALALLLVARAGGAVADAPSLQTWVEYEQDSDECLAATDRDGVRLSFGYDSHHNLTSQTDARGATTRYWYDALGRAVLRQDGLGRVTRVSYDRLGRRSR